MRVPEIESKLQSASFEGQARNQSPTQSTMSYWGTGPILSSEPNKWWDQVLQWGRNLLGPYGRIETNCKHRMQKGKKSMKGAWKCGNYG